MSQNATVMYATTMYVAWLVVTFSWFINKKKILARLEKMARLKWHEDSTV